MEQPTWIGRSLNGRYKIDALLGQGGMSAVYKAIDPNLKRVVAIKLIHPHLSTDEDFIFRFKREAAAVAAFRHPNIVQVYDFNNDNDVYYMVLEFIPGETLQDRLKRLKKSDTKMHFGDAIRIILNVCDALGYAHKQGMIHRDIKPANIMIDTQGQAILMDFGIVKILDATSHTDTGAVLGTARYMSPEVIRSETPDERSDIYSLGVTFYEMLSGDPPFDADSAMSLMMRHLNDPVPDLSSRRSDLPPELIRIVDKALEKDRDQRYRSAAEMAGDLRRLLSTLETAPISKTESPPQADADLAKTKQAAKKETEQVENPTEPWDVSAPANAQADGFFDQPTIADEPKQAPVQEQTPTKKATLPDIPKPEPVKSGLKEGTPPASKPPISPLIKFGGVGVIGIILLVGGWFAFRGAFAAAPEPTSTPTSTQPAPTATVIVSTDTPMLTPTETLTPTLAPTATNTMPPLYVRIDNITIDATNHYVVEYETFGYTEKLPGQHVHFFFNTVPVDQAGLPGKGPWYVYGGPRPFKGYSVSDRPANATQMCALVANPNHTIITESGNCFDLPN